MLIDSNILIDIAADDAQWFDWSIRQIEQARRDSALIINDIIYAEGSVRYRQIADYENFLERIGIVLVPIPAEALFLAGKAFTHYRRASGTKTGVLPDFFIGAACRGRAIAIADARCPAVSDLLPNDRTDRAGQQRAIDNVT